MTIAGKAFAFAVSLGASVSACALVAGLEDWQLASADAADSSVPTSDAEGASTPGPDAGDGGTETGDGGASGCALGCPRVAYDFNAGSGPKLLDITGHGNHASLENGPLWVAGVAGGALSFDGQNDFVSAPPSPSLDVSGQAISILLWVNIDDSKPSGDHVLVGKPWATNVMAPPYYQYGIEYDVDSKALELFFGSNDGTLNSGLYLDAPRGVWTHVAYTYDGAVVKGYVDGVERLSTAIRTRIASRPNTGLRLGVDCVAAQGFKGQLDDVRIYDRALGASEIVALRAAH